MAERWVELTGERYDDRFVCRWHIRFDGGVPTSMGWCGVDCPSQREAVALEFLRERRFVPDERWAAVERAARKEA